MNNLSLFALVGAVLMIAWAVWVARSNGSDTNSVSFVKFRLAQAFIPIAVFGLPWYEQLQTVSSGPWLWASWLVVSLCMMNVVSLLGIVLFGRSKESRLDAPEWAMYVWLISGAGAGLVSIVAGVLALWVPVQ